jgi:uncharacterized membrane protein YraQ (UPF0718 family)
MGYLYWATAAALTASLIADRRKTWTALRLAAKKLWKILPAFLVMLVAISMTLSLIPDTLILKVLSNPRPWISVWAASFLGSVALIPGFVAYPMCGILHAKAVPYMVLSAFSTTLMMVGVVSFPVERAYFGTRVTLMRNLISFGIALVVALVTGLVFGEVTL